MKKYKFKVNYKNYYLMYNDTQKAKIDYMRCYEWADLIKSIRYAIKNDRLSHKDNIYSVHFVAKTINNYSFKISMINNNTFKIVDLKSEV